MSRERLRIPSDTFTTLENGTFIRIRNISPRRAVPGSVAGHEAVHVVAADGEIHSATIIPSENALGTTVPIEMTPTAAAAPAALGYDGVSHDLFITEHVLGVDAGTAMAAARAALSGKEEEVHEVATLLQEKKTIDQSDVDEARNNVRRKRQGIFPVEVAVASPHGELHIHRTEAYREQVLIPGEWVYLDQAA